MVALADKAFEDLVFGGNRLELLQRGGLRDGCRNGHGAAARNRAWNNPVNQRPARGSTHHAEHVGFIGRIDADVARNEFGRVFKRG